MTIEQAFLRRFAASLEKQIDGTLGKILVFRNPENTMPERFAVKTIDPRRTKTGSSFEALRKFSHEIRHWTTYRHHPLVLSPFYTQFEEDWPYIVMPYCHATLRARIVQHDVNVSEAVVLMIEILEALGYAGKKGLLAHQDLKPENVLLKDFRLTHRLRDDHPLRWEVRVADFGLANGYVELGVRSGSRPYLAPEQYESGRDLDNRIDVFACGVMFHELLTGFHPIGKQTHNVWPNPKLGESNNWRQPEKWKKWAHADMKRIDPSIKQDYAALISESLAVEPEARPSITDFKNRLLEGLRKDNSEAHLLLTKLLELRAFCCNESEISDGDDDRYQQRHIETLTKRLH